MSNDLQKAIALLSGGDYTCVLCREDAVHTSDRRGVAPLLNWLDSGMNFRDYSAADRVVGKATAYLYCLLGVKAVFAQVMSKPAEQVLAQHHISASYGTLVDSIENRTKTGPCPMEHATSNSNTPEEALAAVREALKHLTSGSNSL